MSPLTDYERENRLLQQIAIAADFRRLAQKELERAEEELSDALEALHDFQQYRGGR